MKLRKLATAAALSLVLALGLAPGLAQADDVAQQGGSFAPGTLTTQASATVDSVSAAIKALSANPSTFKASDKATIEAINADYESLSDEDKAKVDAVKHSNSDQPLSRILESALWAVRSYKTDNSTKLADGTYDTSTTPAVTSKSDKGKSTSPRVRNWSVKTLTVKDGKATATLALTDGNNKAVTTVASVWMGGKEYPCDEADKSIFPNVPVDLNGTTYFAGNSTIMPAPTMYALSVTIDESSAIKYTDTEGHWALNDGGHNWIQEATNLGLMSGYKGDRAGQFGPDDNIKRRDIAVVLYRSANPGSTDTTVEADYAKKNDTPFTDVDGGQYYTAAINWAYKKGLMTGDKDAAGNPTNKVRPGDDISRQEMATMLYRWSDGAGEAGNGKWQDAPDSADVMDFAKKGIDWCYTNAIMTGDKNTKKLNPQNNATRAQTAKMTVTIVGIMAESAKTGTWEIPTTTTSILTDDEKAVYAAATDAPEGVEPEALLATQTVAGKNYAFLGKSKQGWSIVTLYKNVQGKTSLVANNALDLANLKTTTKSLTKDSGSWTVKAPEGTPELPAKAQAAFTEAMKSYSGMNLVPLTLLGTQVTSGANYLILCEGAPVVPDSVAGIYVANVHEDLQGKTGMTVSQLDLLSYVGAEA